MRYLKKYKIFEQEKITFNLNDEQKDFLNLYATNKWIINNETGLIDIKGSFTCRGMMMENFRGIKFGTVHGNFDIDDNELTSMYGFPRIITDNLHCNNNKIASFEHAPEIIGISMYCTNNKIESMEGVTQDVKSIRVSQNLLKTLKGLPKKLKGNLDVGDNLLESLEGCPEEIGDGLFCGDNKLKNFIGAPKKFIGCFAATDNDITSLEGIPLNIGNWDDGKSMLNIQRQPITEKSLRLIYRRMNENPDMSYGMIIAGIKNLITKEDWEKLDKSSLNKLPTDLRKGYNLLGRIGG